jgi:hypothetical protein
MAFMTGKSEEFNAFSVMPPSPGILKKFSNNRAPRMREGI